MTSALLFTFFLMVAPATNEPGSPLRDVLAALRTMDTIDGCAVGYAGTPGSFFLAAGAVLKQASLDDYRSMIADRHSVVRVMGVLGIVLQHREASDAIAPLLDDKTPLAWMPFGCDMEHRTVGWIVRTLQKEPSVLGLTSSGTVGPPCKRAARPNNALNLTQAHWSLAP